MSLYNAGLDALGDWTTAVYYWMLLTAGTFDADADSIAAILAADGVEVTATGYVRVLTSGATRTVDDANNRITYTSADVSFGSMGAGEIVTAAVLYRHVTNDADAVPIGWWAISPGVATDGLDPFTLAPTSGIVAYTDAA